MRQRVELTSLVGEKATVQEKDLHPCSFLLWASLDRPLTFELYVSCTGLKHLSAFGKESLMGKLSRPTFRKSI